MAVTQVLRGVGKWSISLSPELPKYILDRFVYYGHITIHPAHVDPRAVGDALLQDARYTGVYRSRNDKSDGTTVMSGAGMAIWLGDEDGKGKVQETLLNLNGAFHTVVPTILPPSVSAGTIFNIGQDFVGKFQYVNPRQMLDYITQTLGAAWRVNNDASVDAGNEADLFVTDPKVIVARNRMGRDLLRRALAGDLETEQDVEDFTTRVVLLASGTDGSAATGDADILPGLNFYKDLFGNSVEFTRMVQESGTDEGNAAARAQLQLNRFTGTRDSLTLSSDEYDIPGDIDVGDYLWVFDPDKKIQDVNNQVYAPWGEYINPMKLQLTEQAWPVTRGMGVAYRDPDGLWYDLTDYLVPESGETTIVVGGYNRSLTSGDGGVAVSPAVPDSNTTIPGVPSFVTPFQTSVYLSATGEVRAQTRVAWLQPDNTDTTDITDGGYYELRYRTTNEPLWPATHSQLGPYTHTELGLLGTFGSPLEYPTVDWNYQVVPWDEQKFMLTELAPSMPYEVQIRAVDIGSSSTPPNAGAWSASSFFQTARDTLPPATPAEPEIAASTLSVQMVHRLGRSDGGEYNLDLDLAYIELHGWTDPLFKPTNESLLGKVAANVGLLIGEIPAVATFPIKEVVPLFFKAIAVDTTGNKSLPSSAVEAQANLVDDLHVSDLSVSKLTAGEMTADVIIGGVIRTAKTGQRVELDYQGIHQYDSQNRMTVDINSAKGTALFAGTVQSGLTQQKVVIDPGPTDASIASIKFYDDIITHYTQATHFGNAFLLQKFTAAGGTAGGKILFNGSDSAYFSCIDESGVESYVGVGSGGITFKGVFDKTISLGGQSALHCDQVGSSGTSLSYSYGVTYSGAPWPFITVQSTSGGPGGRYSVIATRSTTGFTTSQVDGNYDVFIWAARGA